MSATRTARTTRRPAPRARQVPLRVEELENRTVPAVITVTSLLDNLTDDGLVTLREAIQAANNTPVADTIQFAPGLTGPIDLSIIDNTTNGPTALQITTPITIDGFNGNDGITIQRAGVVANLRLFGLTTGAELTLRGITLANGVAEGAPGLDGLGGAIFNDGGTLNVLQSLLRDNSAIGGVSVGNLLGGDGLGGAIFSTNGGVVNLQNSTLYANLAAGTNGGEGIGGGIANVNSVLNILNGTLSDNVGNAARNVYNLADGLFQTATTTINDSILGQAGDSTVTDFLNETANGALSALSTGVGNLIRNPGNFVNLTNLLGGVLSTLDPLLGPLTDNGGPTDSLLPGLPAIDVGLGNLLSLSVDQRGVLNLGVLGLGVDVGAIQIGPDTIAPTVLSVTSTSPDGTYNVGQGVNVTVNFSERVTLSGGNMIVTLDNGATVTIAPFSGTKAIGTYTIASGPSSPDLDSTGLTLAAGATLRDAAGNNANLAIPGDASLGDNKDIVVNGTADTVAPTIASITSTTADGTYGVNASINVTVNFAEPVTLSGGNLILVLNSGATVTIAPFSGSSAVGTYTVAGGQFSTDLDVTAVALGAGATLRDAAGNAANLAVPADTSLGDLRNIRIDTTGATDTTAPTVTIGPPSAAATARGPVTFTVTYGDPNFSSSSLTAANVTLNRTGTATGTVIVSAGTGNTRIVTITNIRGTGTLSISIAAGTATDMAGNQAAGAGPSAAVTVTNTPLLAVGTSNGSLRLFNTSTGRPALFFRPLDVPGWTYTGSIQVATGDLNRDGVADVYAAAGESYGGKGLHPNRAGKVFVYDGAALARNQIQLIRVITPFGRHAGPDGRPNLPYRNGVSIAVADVNGDGYPDLIAGTRPPTVRGGFQEYGRVTVTSGGPTPASFGPPVRVFGSGYTGGFVLAAGDLDGALNAAGLPQAEIAVTRNGPLGKHLLGVRAFKWNGGGLAALNLTATGANLTPFAGIRGPGGRPLTLNPGLAFVDRNGDGRSEFTVSVLDPISNRRNPQVRIATFSVNTNTGLAQPEGSSSGPGRSFTVGSAVRTQGIAEFDHDGNGTYDLAVVSQRPTGTTVLFLDPFTGAARLGTFALDIPQGRVTVDGF
ncbi:FG-GAP repeat protein OS=Oscillatoria nigro-viridis PCC 7112 GN=Osc7112_5529 PE=4 SV=1: FG-GAP [Gemmataceae bacterium]|nr:FG-GAP repeat protein OS=Oscillatoria nigro-viridis PCC 7112 GN=Osc7112_5529 PE=4 SV=1: FG-GAP [Gemmataceae bacterium]VTT96504.1 FG-GAP repeat protein OS=Oscillatoria nigro-viridis PCC 7112 GN=Osc7112_5529 PE=4 SV=1: FG-GAP [Gemmataceae bacterium]